MNCDEIMEQLALMVDEKRKKILIKQGVNNEVYGIPLGKLRAFGKKIGTNHEIALKLWHSDNFDAMYLATMIIDVKKLEEADLMVLLNDCKHELLVDELTFKVLVLCSFAKKVMKEWISESGLVGRAGWNLAIGLVMKNKLSNEMIDFLLDDIEQHLQSADPLKQWAMNRCLCEVGIRSEDYRGRCLMMGENLGVYKDVKVAKGCTSPYAPDWIEAGIRIQTSRNRK